MSDRLLKELDVLKAIDRRIKESLIESEFLRKNGRIDVMGAKKHILVLPSADRPRAEWIFHYRDKWMVKAECPKCHRRFEFSPRTIWKCCPMCETRMKGAHDE